VLARLHSRGSPVPGGRLGLAESLLAAFGLEPGAKASGQAPSAPFCYLADARQGDADAYRLHADPVHLRLDRDRLRLYDARHLDLSQAEVDALVGVFNDHFAGEGLTLEAPTGVRWYLRVNEAPDLCTTPLESVVGREVAPFLPTGGDASHWLSLINEAQMLFAQAEPNRRREGQGRLPVSGIWPWGGGALSDWQPHSPYGSVFADHPLAVGLARRSRVAAQALAAVASGLELALRQGPVLVVWDRLWPAVVDADPRAWAQGMAHLEDWLGQAQRLLGSRRLDHWDLDGCDGSRRRIGRLDAWRLWRRVRPLGELLARA
jgi:hypothetical protein